MRDRRPVSIAGVMSGGTAMESFVHERLAPWALGGEWFRRDGEVTAAILAVRRLNRGDTFAPVRVEDFCREMDWRSPLDLAAGPGGTLGKRLRAARLFADKGSVQLAKAIGCSHGAVSAIEAAGDPRLRADHALALARELGVRVEWLVLGEYPIHPTEVET